MERLPDEVVSEVLRRLALAELLAAARVCRRWAALVRRRLLVVRRRGQEARVGGATRALLVTARGTALAPLLRVATALRELTVHARVPLDAEALRALQHLPHLRHLDVFARRRVLDAAVVPAARRLAALVANDSLAPGVLRALRDARRLSALHMYGRAQYFPPRELRLLAGARRDSLRELTLRCGELGDAAYEAIGACGALVELRLYSCWLLTERGAAHVARAARLRVLHVTGARLLRPRALGRFLSALPPLVAELSLSAGWASGAHAAALGARLPALRVLEAWRCGLAAADVRALAAALPALRDLDVDAPLAPDDVRALRRHGALERLRCAGAGAGAGAGAAGGLAVRSATERAGRGALRGGGEGPRAAQFYSWGGGGRGALPAAPRVVSDSEEEDRWLLGSERDSD